MGRTAGAAAAAAADAEEAPAAEEGEESDRDVAARAAIADAGDAGALLPAAADADEDAATPALPAAPRAPGAVPSIGTAVAGTDPAAGELRVGIAAAPPAAAAAASSSAAGRRTGHAGCNAALRDHRAASAPSGCCLSKTATQGAVASARTRLQQRKPAAAQAPAARDGAAKAPAAHAPGEKNLSTGEKMPPQVDDLPSSSCLQRRRRGERAAAHS
jgi:hypothetical protein